jgi:hypothetical protein
MLDIFHMLYYFVMKIMKLFCKILQVSGQQNHFDKSSTQTEWMLTDIQSEHFPVCGQAYC